MHSDDATKHERLTTAEPPISLRFVAIENRVHDNLRRLVCRARSGNMAKRIARALNIVQPNERGQ